jgi:hypothetical protein
MLPQTVSMSAAHAARLVPDADVARLADAAGGQIRVGELEHPRQLSALESVVAAANAIEVVQLLGRSAR